MMNYYIYKIKITQYLHHRQRPSIATPLYHLKEVHNRLMMQYNHPAS
jgi:hypothetical protein